MANCAECGKPVSDVTGECPFCRPVPESQLAATADSPASVVMRKNCSVCSACGADVAPKANFCPRCRVSFDGSPVPPAPPVKYHCLSCNADLPAGSAFCPKCGLTITHFYAPGEPLSQADTQRQYIQSLTRKQQTAWTWLILGLVITFLSWFVCR